MAGREAVCLMVHVLVREMWVMSYSSAGHKMGSCLVAELTTENSWWGRCLLCGTCTGGNCDRNGD